METASSWCFTCNREGNFEREYRTFAPIERKDVDCFNEPMDGLDILECDFDKGGSKLFYAMQQKRWEEAVKLLEPNEILQESVLDENSADVLSKTWVYRKASEGALKWRINPMHAAILFDAPIEILEKLLDLHPNVVMLKDDQGNLPLHLAFKNGTCEEKISLLVNAHPSAMKQSNDKGLLPLQCTKFCHIRRSAVRTYLRDAVEKEVIAKKVRDVELKTEEETKEIVKRMHEENDAEIEKMRQEHEAWLQSLKVSATPDIKEVGDGGNADEETNVDEKAKSDIQCHAVSPLDNEAPFEGEKEMKNQKKKKPLKKAMSRMIPFFGRRKRAGKSVAKNAKDTEKSDGEKLMEEAALVSEGETDKNTSSDGSRSVDDPCLAD